VAGCTVAFPISGRNVAAERFASVLGDHR